MVHKMRYFSGHACYSKRKSKPTRKCPNLHYSILSAIMYPEGLYDECFVQWILNT